MSLNKPVNEWEDEFLDVMTLYQQDYFYTFAALCIIIFKISLPEVVFTPLVTYLL